MIEDIHLKISEEYKTRGLTAYSTIINPASMGMWAVGLSNKYNLDEFAFDDQVRELYWSLNSIQTGLGYIFICINEVQLPSGLKYETYDNNDLQSLDVPDIHFWFHLQNAWESVYRLWERVVTVLEFRLAPEIRNEGLYFDGLVTYLEKNNYFVFEDIKSLKSYTKGWNKVAEKRNLFSHEKTNPFDNLKTEVSFSPFVKYTGEPIEKYNFEFPNLKQEVETLINYYKKSFELIKLVKNICELEINPDSKP